MTEEEVWHIYYYSNNNGRKYYSNDRKIRFIEKLPTYFEILLINEFKISKVLKVVKKGMVNTFWYIPKMEGCH